MCTEFSCDEMLSPILCDRLTGTFALDLPTALYHQDLIKRLPYNFMYTDMQMIKEILDLMVGADHISCEVSGYILSGWVVKEDYWGGCITLESPQ